MPPKDQGPPGPTGRRGCPPLPAGPDTPAAPRGHNRKAQSTPWSRNINLVPFRHGLGACPKDPPKERRTTRETLAADLPRSGECTHPALSEQVAPVSKDRLTHVQLMLTWNPSPTSAFKLFHLNNLLLPPRSALKVVPPRVTPRLRHGLHAPAYSSVLTSKAAPRRGSVLLSRRRWGLGSLLERHPFSGPIHSAGKLLHTS